MNCKKFIFLFSYRFVLVILYSHLRSGNGVVTKRAGHMLWWGMVFCGSIASYKVMSGFALRWCWRFGAYGAALDNRFTV